MSDTRTLNIVQRDSLPVVIDGLRWEIRARDLSQSRSLSDFIHTHLGRTSRQACGEGGCGACSVIVTRPRPVADAANGRSIRFERYSVAACVTPIGDLAFAAITTSQGGQGGSAAGQDGPTPAQEALQTTNAAQCGFCTGGIVSVLDSECSGKGRSCAEVESLLDGNLCRCTGYRSISEAAQMLCDDYEGRFAQEAREIRERARAYRQRAEDAGSFPPSLRTEYEHLFCNPDVDGVALVERVLADENSGGPGIRGTSGALVQPDDEILLRSHVRPASLAALAALYAEAPGSIEVLAGGGAARWEGRVLTAGFTDAAYAAHRSHRVLQHTLSLRDVPELRAWSLREDGELELGATVPVGELRTIEASLADGGARARAHAASLRALTTQIRYFANENVRHTGTIGGGLVSCHHLSDLIPVWVALDARAVLVSEGEGRKTVPVRELIDQSAGRLALGADEVVVSLVLPAKNPRTFLAESFKQGIRRTDSMTLVSAAITADRDEQGTLHDVCIALAGMGVPGLRASRAESALEGANVATPEQVDACLAQVLPILDEEAPLINQRELPPAMRDYQTEIAGAFVRRFLHMACPQPGSYEDAHRFHQPPCRGQQIFDEHRVTEHVVGRALNHRYIGEHTRGDTQYTGDEQVPEEALHAAIVPAPIARGRLRGFDATACAGVDDFVTLYTAADIPGSNLQGHMVRPLGEEEILCSEQIVYRGQPVALALAHSQAGAEQAAALVQVKTSPDTRRPVLNFDDIEQQDSFFAFEENREEPAREPLERKFERGDPRAAFARAEADPEHYATLQGRLEVGGQSCFYLEPQAAVAYPRSEDGMRVLSSTQSPSHVAQYVASALGVRSHLIEVEAGFVGGGFGGKQTRSASFAAMAALAARHTGVPVKLVLPREVDMTLVPGRSPFRGDFKLAVERGNGKILALDIDMLVNGGAAEDYSPSIAETSVFLIDNAYYFEHAKVRTRCGRSNLPAGFTATRGYGKPQTGALIESILDEAAAHLGMDPQVLRERNLYRQGQTALAGTPIDDDVLRECWRRAVSVQYDGWRSQCDAFNRQSTTVKRGVAGVPSKGNMGFLEAADINRGAAVVRIHTDGSVRISHSGVEMGQGINTRMTQVAAQALSVPVESVLLDATSTGDLPNTPPTTMVATDMVGAAILKACDELLATLAEAGYPERSTFAAAVAHCYETGLPLQATGFAQEPRLRFDWERQQGDVSYFFVWGAALSEVEVDAGTGSWRVLRTHVTQDCGRSLNPLLDIGQVEGAFAFGLGYALLEKMIYREDGSLLTDNVSSYKVPSVDDMPRDWTVEILQETEGPPGRRGLHNSKGVGEANIQLGFSAYFAVKDAIRAIREGRGLAPDAFDLPFPAMPYDILRACR